MNKRKTVTMSWKCFFLTALLFIKTSSAAHDGGADGADGSDFIDGTPYTVKSIIGATCTRDDTDATVGTLELRIYHGDHDYKYEATSVINPGKRIIYQVCEFIDAEVFSTSSVAVPTGCTFQLIDPTANINNPLYENITHAALVDIDFDANPVLPCGGYPSAGNIYRYAVHCRRFDAFDAKPDVLFIAEISDDKDDCLVNKIGSYKVVVGKPPQEIIETNLEVSAKLYSYDEGTYDSLGVAGGNEITVAVPLGTNIYFEMCLHRLGGSSPADLYFKDDGITPLGVKVFSCVATPDLTGQDSADENAEEEIVNSDGCGTEKNPAAQLATDNYAFQYVVDPNDAAGYAWTHSPNCFRTTGFEAMRFADIRPLSDGVVVFTCQLDYCTHYNDPACFGIGATPGLSYDGMCPAARRKKRDSNFEEFGIPSQISVKLRIKPSQGNGTTSTVKDISCFEKNTFIGLSSGLGILLLVVLVVAVYLAIRLWRDDDDDRSRSTDSMTGIKNKAYY
ncbi:hypothetical protein ACF0H5_022884 [Mactra antiquata]